MSVEEWYTKTFCGGNPIPEGVTINAFDHRADQSCSVCGEFVDSFGSNFTSERCSIHND